MYCERDGERGPEHMVRSVVRSSHRLCGAQRKPENSLLARFVGRVYNGRLHTVAAGCETHKPFLLFSSESEDLRRTAAWFLGNVTKVAGKESRSRALRGVDGDPDRPRTQPAHATAAQHAESPARKRPRALQDRALRNMDADQ